MAANLLFLLLVATGFYAAFFHSWSLWYQANLLFHPLLGLLLAAASVAYLRRHLREKHRKRSEIRAVIAIPSRAIGAALVGLLILLFLTGLLVASGAAGPKIIQFHRKLAYAATLLYAVHVARVLCRTLAGAETRRTALSARPLQASLVGCLVLVALGVWGARERTRTAEIDLLSSLEAGGQATVSAREMNLTTCGLSGCHADLTEQYERTAHFLSPQTHHFQKIAALLKEERGEESVRFCATCHAPAAALSPSFSAGFQDGISCLGCHAIGEVFLGHKEKGYEGDREGFVYVLNDAHLAMLQPVNEEGEISPLARYLIQLNPAGHGRVFMRPIVRRDDLCLSCHQQHIPKPVEASFVQPRCADCHMRLQRDLSGLEATMPHLFAGANNVLPYLRDDQEMLKIVHRWVEGDLRTGATPDAFWELRTSPTQQASRAFWLIMDIEAIKPLRRGEEAAFRVFTSNAGIGHPFPTGVLDMYDVWLRFEVRDETGRLVFRSGRGGGIYYENDTTHRLGGYFYDRSGRPIERHRIWEKAGEKRTWIEPGKTRFDDYKFFLPPDTGPLLLVKAAWYYDRLNRPFLAWAYGKRLKPPTLKVAATEKQMRVEPN